ncbi:type II toxin-antitoxin system TacA family antitoxin [Acinetobacter baumannii]
MTNNEFIEIHLDAKTKQLAEQAAVVLGYSALTEFFIYLIQNHAPQVLQEHAHIQLSHAQFEQFVEVCQTQNKIPTRLKQAAQLLDKENF